MDTSVMPSAEIVFDTLFAYQRSAALKSAIELDVFTAIDSGTTTASAIATRCKASERGIRILCDFLCTIGLLGKSGECLSNHAGGGRFPQHQLTGVSRYDDAFSPARRAEAEHGNVDGGGGSRHRSAGRQQQRIG